MRFRLSLLAACALAALAVVGTAAADHPGGGGTPFFATLTGPNECRVVSGTVVCGTVGHPTATGTAELRLNSGQEEICGDINVVGLTGADTVVGAHIHPGAAGQIGPVLVPLITPTKTSPTTAVSSGCGFAPREVIKAIRKNPENFYVNVHTLPGFGPGAVRGQLCGPGRGNC